MDASDDDGTMLSARRRGHLYIVECQQPTRSLGQANVVSKQQITLHCRFGHQMTLPDVPRGRKITGQECDACVEGKMARRPFLSSDKRSSQIAEKIHSDVIEPITPTSLGRSPICNRICQRLLKTHLRTSNETQGRGST